MISNNGYISSNTIEKATNNLQKQYVECSVIPGFRQEAIERVTVEL